MAAINVVALTGNKAGTVELDDAVFGIQPNVPVMHQVVTAQLAARRAGTQSTKTRAEAQGGGAKPWRQKGTGRARQGSNRAPHWVGGGVAHAPKPRSYAQRTPKKMVRLALRSALSDRANDGKIVVVDSWGFDGPSTKEAVKALGSLGVDGRLLVVITEADEAAWLSFRNLQNVHCVLPRELNAYDVLVADYVVFTKETLPSSAKTDVAEGEAAKDETPVVVEKKAAAKKTQKAEPAETTATTDEPDEDDAPDPAEAGVGSASEQSAAERGTSEAGDTA